MPLNTSAQHAEDDAFTTNIARTLSRLADRPADLRATLNGMALDGTLLRCGLPAELAPLTGRLAKETPRSIRERMADLMLRRVSADGSITRDELRGGGFTDEQIDKHHHDAARLARLARLAI